ncbi:MAG TPA: hypothetical protein VMZ27_06970 [Candidatus Saccharimonadales bacterium]|nr:hypothetical protein [Candidatus Saccharimonadales bacterium]
MRSGKRLQHSQVHERRIPIEQPSCVREVAQGRAFAAGSFQRSLPVLLRFQHVPVSALQLAREHHILHLHSKDGDPNFGRVRLNTSQQLRREIRTRGQQRFRGLAAKNRAQRKLSSVINVRLPVLGFMSGSYRIFHLVTNHQTGFKTHIIRREDFLASDVDESFAQISEVQIAVATPDNVAASIQGSEELTLPVKQACVTFGHNIGMAVRWHEAKATDTEENENGDRNGEFVVH